MNTETPMPWWVGGRSNDRYATPRALRTYRNREWFARQLDRGKTLHEIAIAGGISVHTIQSWKYRYNLKASSAPVRPRVHLGDAARETYGNRAWLAAQVKRGLSDQEIARLCKNILAPRIARWRARFGIKRGPVILSHRALKTYANREWLARALKTRTTYKVATSLGVSESTILNWRARFNIPALPCRTTRSYLSEHARATYANREWLLARIEEGKTFVEIAHEARISRYAIVSWARRHGLTRGKNIRISALKTYANREWLAAQAAEGRRDTEIAKQCGCSSVAIGQWRHRFGLPQAPRKTGPFPKDEQARRAFGAWLTSRLSDLPLDEREVKILKAMHGVQGPVRTLKDVGAELVLTRERVRQINKRGLRKIVAAVGAPALKDFPKIAALPPFVAKGRKTEKGQAKLLIGDATYANREWLAAEVAAGKTDKKIAAEVGVTKLTIFLWRKRHGIAANHHRRTGRTISPLALKTYADPAWLRTLVELGLTDHEIAAYAGCTRLTISNWRRRFSIPPSRGRPASPDTPI